jgi:large subunit ribosomal protein L18
MSKQSLLARQRKVKKIRQTIKEFNKVRLSVHRTPKHIRAQVIAPDGKVLASASSLEKVVRQDQEVQASNKKKTAAAKLVGKLVAERSQGKVDKVAFDRSGFKYHGRIAALADSAREFGLNF